MSPDVYQLINGGVSFHFLYLLSPRPFDGVVYTDGKMPPPPTGTPIFDFGQGPRACAKRWILRWDEKVDPRSRIALSYR